MDAAEKVLHDELRFIRNAVLSGDKGQLLRTLDERGTAEEIIEREYGGRYVFELLQNANDAAGAKGAVSANHRVAIAITEHSLLVANEGEGFGPENVRSICTLGRSSKDPRKTLGYKGLGFKAVGELTDQPQVISPPYRFGFSIDRARREVTKLTGPLPPGQRLPRYAFPFPLRSNFAGKDADQVSALLEQGFITVIRLPFKSAIAWKKVLEQVRSAITPELLLFLDATTEITISWPDGYSRMYRSQTEAVEDAALIEIGRDDQPPQRWLVFRSAPITLPNTRLVETLDRTWHRVRRVSATIAFPIEGGRLAVDQPQRAVSVYFPTESQTGHTFIINADFYVDLDRRYISDTPQACPYNTWLAERVGWFFGHTVLPALARRFTADYRVVHACAPVASPTGFGTEIAKQVRSALERTRFVPTSSDAVTPRAALRSPVARGFATTFHHFFDTPDLGAVRGNLVHVDVENDRRAAEFVQTLGAGEVADDAILRFLRHPPVVAVNELPDFYVLLARWLNHHESDARRGVLRAELKRRKLIYTFDGRWVTATEPVFFPRTRTSTEIPEGFPGNILHADCTDGRQEAQRLLEDLGVQPFRWREVILTSLLPTIKRKPTDRQIEAAHRFLRIYFDEERGGDREVAEQIGIVPVRARTHRRRSWVWRPAGKTYFSSVWLDNPDVQDLYQILGQQEFLAESVPDDAEALLRERAYFAWLGVADKPRVIRFDSQIQPGSTAGRPEGADAGRWRAYVGSLAEQMTDPQGHPLSQRLQTHALDRLDELLAHATPKQGQALLRLLAGHWDSYAPVFDAEIRCMNGQHHGERSRPVRSYAAFVLRATAWVPVRIGNTTRMLPASKVWLTGADVPRRLGQLLPQIAADIYPPQVLLVGNALDFVNPATASANDYINLLAMLPTVFPLPAPPSLRRPRQRRMYEEQTVDLARWVMRNLNYVLPEEPSETQSELPATADTPLLAINNGEASYARQPVVVDDVRLAKKLGNRFAWFQGDRGWTRLVSAFGLHRVSEIASIEPIPGDPVDDITKELTRRTEEASAYVLALVDADAPSELTTARGRLGRLTISVVEHLTLKVSVRSAVPEELLLDEDGYLKQTRLAGSGAIRTAMATYYCAMRAAHDFYRMGAAIADFLERPALGDAFSIVLRSGRDERLRFLASKGIDNSRIRAMRDLLGRPEEEGEEDEVIVPRPGGSGGSQGSSGRGGGAQGHQQGGAGPQAGGQRKDGQGGQRDEEPPLPPLNGAQLTVVDARDGRFRAHQSRGSGGGSSGSGRNGDFGGRDDGTQHRHLNWEELEAKRRRYGRRGEEAVYEAERSRLRSAGLDPEGVRWISRENEVADHDLESIDHDGQTMYIEVKSTDSEDAAEPFLITSAELRFAARHRSRYFIYRVTNVRDPGPSITRYRDPVGLWQGGQADTEVTQARMWLPMQNHGNGDAPVPG